MSTQFVVSLPSFHLPLKKNQSPTRLLLPTKCFSVSRSIAPPLTLTKSGFCSHISSLSVISKNIEGFGDFEPIGGRISTTSRGGVGIKASVRKTGNKTILKSKRSSRKRLPPIQPGDRIDYRNISLISRFVSEQGKILSRRINRLTLKQQRLVTSAIKQARILSLLPFLNNEKQYEATASRRAEANTRSGGFRARKR